jgi:NAD(P)-dependent dehydrogenase (short-subunit alcohol dehydrogenase family)
LLDAGGGAVINIASVVALRPEPVFDAYTASKGGAVALTGSIAHYDAPRRVRANAVVRSRPR